MIDALEVDVDDEVPRRGVTLGQMRDRLDQARVVDEDIEAAEALDSRVDGGLDILVARDI